MIVTLGVLGGLTVMGKPPATAAPFALGLNVIDTVADAPGCNVGLLAPLA